MGELAMYERVADPIAAAKALGEAMAKSGIFGCPNPESGMVIAITCLCEGITPLDFYRRYHLIAGKPSMKSDAMLAEFRQAGGTHKVIAEEPDVAEIELTVDGYTKRFRMTWEQAKKEKWPYAKDGRTLKDNWATPEGRRAMLWARTISRAVKRMKPEINAGIYTPEETADFVDEPSGNGKALPTTQEALQIAAAREDTISDEPKEEVVSDYIIESDKPEAVDESVIERMLKSAQMVWGDKAKATLLKAASKRGKESLETLSADEAQDIFEKVREKELGFSAIPK